MTTIGKPFAMVDSVARVTGTIGYALNFELPKMLSAAVLRSPHPHARLLRVDTSKAERLPGVGAVLSQNDLRGAEIDPYFGQLILDQAPVAIDKVRFVGDPVAAVAAVDEDTARGALELIEVEYRELPAVFDPVAALEPGAPLLHEGPRRILPGRPDVEARSLEGTNIVHLFKQRKGDAARGLREADLVIDHTYDSPAAQHVPMEPHVAVAEFKNGRVTVWTGSQNPHTVQRQLAAIFRVPVADVRVIVFTLGGGFGAKLNSKVEPLAALLARKVGRPVKVSLPREEDFVVAAQHAATIKMKTAVKRDGTLVATEALCYFNSGAYADTTPNLITRAYAATGPYRVPHVYVDSYGVYTNTVPTSAFRGYGITQVAWAHESQMDIIADSLGIDPLELRLKNVLRKGDAFSTGEPMAEMHYPELLKAAADKVGWHEGPLVVRDGNKIRAKGLSATIKSMATPTTSSASVKLNVDGSLNVATSSVEMGQGVKTGLGQIAADEAGIPLEKVLVSEPDTEFTPFDWMTASSRSTLCMGSAIRMAVRVVKDQLLDAAAEHFEAAKEDLVLENGRVAVKGVSGRSLSYADLIRLSKRNNLLGSGTFIAGTGTDGSPVVIDSETGQGYASAQWHPAVIACEVEVDVDTGKWKVTRMHAEMYVGRVINPRLCEMQVEGATILGLGQALFEELVLDTDGRVTNPNLSDYMIPAFEDMPRELTVHFLEPEGVTEVHGVGEAALPPVRPAIGNAVSRAIGLHLFSPPITAESVLRALTARSSG